VYPPRSPTIRDVNVFDGVAGVAIGDMSIGLWRTPARRERIRTVMSWTEEHLRETDGTIAACQFLLPSASPPDGPGRAETWRGFKIVEPRARRLVTIPLGDRRWFGVVSAIIRAGIAVWGRGQLIKIASSEKQAFDLLLQVASPQSPTRAQLEEGLDLLHDALGVERPRRAT